MQDFELYKIVKRPEGDEQIIFKVLEDCNLSYYLILDNSYDEDGRVSNTHRHCYAFPNVNVRRGDYVVLYTGRGSQTSFNNNAHTTTHVFYWGFAENASVWNNVVDRVFLIKIGGVQAYTV